MNLLNLMQPEYVKARYELDEVKVLAPVAEGESFVAVGKQIDADVVMYVASGKSESAAYVNLAALICKNTQSPDVEEHVFAYYEELPKYKNTPEEDLWKFADDITAKFRQGEVISEDMMREISEAIVDNREAHTQSYIVVRVSENIIPVYKTFYDTYLFESVDTLDEVNECFICDKVIEAGLTLCAECQENVNKR